MTRTSDIGISPGWQNFSAFPIDRRSSDDDQVGLDVCGNTIKLAEGREGDGEGGAFTYLSYFTYQMFSLSTFSGRLIVQVDCSPKHNAKLYGNK